jgi:hypothetical protein
MAELTGVNGQVWGIPFGSTIVRLDDADVGQMIGAMSGLARVLALVAGGLALAMLAVSAIGAHRQRSEQEIESRLAWLGVACVKTTARNFIGFPLIETIKIKCDGEVLEIPICLINDYYPYEIWKSNGRSSTLLTMEDGSQYRSEIIELDDFKVITSIGIQIIDILKYHEITGCILPRSDNLRKNIKNYLEQNANEAERVVGMASFSKWFVMV